MVVLATWSCLSAGPGPEFIPGYLASYPLSFKAAVNAPAAWGTDDWIVAGSLALAAGGLYLADPGLRRMSQEIRTEASDRAFDGLAYAGDYRILFPAAVVTATAGCLAGSNNTTNTGLLVLKSMILSSVTTQVLKLATQKSRPENGTYSDFWSAGVVSLDHDSFPSGHSTLVWSVAPILAEQYKEQIWVAPLVYGLAVLSSYARVNNDEHWASDVFCGAVIGCLSARLTLQTTPRISVAPALELGGLMLELEF